MSYVGNSDTGIFVISPDAMSAMIPVLISVDDNPTHGNHSTISTRMPIISWGIPYGLGEGLHFRLEIDTVNTFNTRNLLLYESKYTPDLFLMYDGISWIPFPSEGTVFGATQAKILLPDTFFNGKFYVRVIPEV